MNPSDSSFEIAEHLAGVTYDKVPEDARAAAIRSIVDTVAVMMAGSGTEVMGRVLAEARRIGGAPHASVWGHVDRVPDTSAVLVNAAAAHQHDFDDTHDTAVCHPTSASLNAALAVAEAEGGIDGQRLIAAVAAGSDLSCRLALAIEGDLWAYPWVRAPVVGVFGASAAAGVVLGLDADRMHAALGLALPQAAGTLESVIGHSSMVRTIRDGLAYRDGVLAARLAQSGVRGDRRVFDGPYGLYAAYFRGEYDRVQLVEGLGDRFEGRGVSLKPWPSCRHTHATITGVLDVLERTGRRGADVVDLEVFVGDGNRRLFEKVWPESRADALCHLPFVLGALLSHDGLSMSTFEEAAIADPTVRQAAERIRWTLDHSQEKYGTIEPGKVRATFKDGSVTEVYVDRALGHPLRPLDDAGQTTKWRDCLERAANPPADGGRALLDMLRGLAGVPDVRELSIAAASRA